MGTFVDRTGARYGMLTSLLYLGSGMWWCACDCGEMTVTRGGHMDSGNTKSCGCRKRAVLGESTTKHGGAGTRTYRIWKAIKSRCFNPKSSGYKDYGGRGITMDPRWANDYAAFLSDMGACPDGMSVERSKNGQGYVPGNCVWATPAQQNLNKRNSLFINGVPMKTFAAQQGVSYYTIYDRYRRGVYGLGATQGHGELVKFSLED